MLDNFKYEDGNLINLKPRSNCKVGDVVGTVNSRGYLDFTFNYKRYYVHRVIWEMHNRPLRKGEYIDHINGDKLDNRIENLRVCNNAQNNYNVGKQSNNTSGYKGISRKNNRWRVQVKHSGGTVDRLFKDLEDAVAFSIATREKYHGSFACHA